MGDDRYFCGVLYDFIRDIPVSSLLRYVGVGSVPVTLVWEDALAYLARYQYR